MEKKTKAVLLEESIYWTFSKKAAEQHMTTRQYIEQIGNELAENETE